MRKIGRGNGLSSEQTECWELAAAAPPATDSGGGVSGGGALVGRLRLQLWLNLVFWFSTSFSYYGLSLSAGNLGGSIYMNFALMSAIELPADALAAWLCDVWGRRPTLAASYLIGGASCLLCMVLPPGQATVAAALVGKFAVAGAFGGIYVYSSELFPAAVRSQAMGLASASGRLGGIAAPAVVLLASVSVSLPFVIFGGSCIAAALCFVWLPETLRAQPAAQPAGKAVMV